jgi:hypothetical protein
VKKKLGRRDTELKEIKLKSESLDKVLEKIDKDLANLIEKISNKDGNQPENIEKLKNMHSGLQEQ